MRREILRSVLCVIVMLVPAAPAPAALQPNDLVTLRIRFGFKDKDPTDWSGSIIPASGKVESIRGWRWVAGDTAEGNAWIVGTRRPPAQNAAERRRVNAGEKLPMADNGVIVTLSGVKPTDEIKFDAKP